MPPNVAGECRRRISLDVAGEDAPNVASEEHSNTNRNRLHRLQIFIILALCVFVAASVLLIVCIWRQLSSPTVTRLKEDMLATTVYDNANLCRNLVPVRVATLNFPGGAIIPGVSVLAIQESPKRNTYHGTTGLDGRVTFNMPIGAVVTFVGTKDMQERTQTATFTVPYTGMITPITEAVLQMPSKIVYGIMLGTLPLKNKKIKSEGHCLFCVAVTRPGRPVGIMPQGWTGAKIHLWQYGKQKKIPPFFSIIKPGGTNPSGVYFAKMTSIGPAGGGLFANVPESDDPYMISAEKYGVLFSHTVMRCPKRDYAAERNIAWQPFINAAPMNGPIDQTPVAPVQVHVVDSKGKGLEKIMICGKPSEADPGRIFSEEYDGEFCSVAGTNAEGYFTFYPEVGQKVFFYERGSKNLEPRTQTVETPPNGLQAVELRLVYI